jgi:hypothetical protein
MFFLNQAKDTPLLQEIIREGVFNSALWESFALPGEGYLMDVLVANKEKIPEKPWIDWLIRKHNCTRIPSIEPSAAFVKGVDRQLLSESLKADCYLLSVAENHLYVGIGRPDFPDFPRNLLKSYKKSILYHNALSVNEIANMRKLCGLALQSL